MATCVGTKGADSKSEDMLPLTVDFRPSAAALGRIPTTRLRRDLQSDTDVLYARAIDRSIRPLFPREWRRETQVVCTPMQVDEDGDLLVLGLNAASTALRLSPIPVEISVAAVRVARVSGEVNPDRHFHIAAHLESYSNSY